MVSMRESMDTRPVFSSDFCFELLTYFRSREFRQIACLLMAHPFPLALFWGAELTVIYNQAYAQTVAGMKHPQLMGTGFRGPFKELCKSPKHSDVPAPGCQRLDLLPTSVDYSVRRLTST